MTSKKRNHVAFPIQQDLRERAEAVIEAVRKDSTPRAHVGELIEVIVELTDTGLYSYFLAPLERLQVGALSLAAAKVGVATAGKSLPALVRRVVSKMTDQQLEELVEAMDEMMV